MGTGTPPQGQNGTGHRWRRLQADAMALTLEKCGVSSGYEDCGVRWILLNPSGARKRKGDRSVATGSKVSVKRPPAAFTEHHPHCRHGTSSLGRWNFWGEGEWLGAGRQSRRENICKRVSNKFLKRKNFKEGLSLGKSYTRVLI